MKLTHRNILVDVDCFSRRIQFDEETVTISYLPYPHLFEQCLSAAVICMGGRVGYFNGNPLTLIEDCAVLQPTFFPSVPRLYNKIYSKIQGQVAQATGCKAWLLASAISAKTANA